MIVPIRRERVAGVTKHDLLIDIAKKMGEIAGITNEMSLNGVTDVRLSAFDSLNFSFDLMVKDLKYRIKINREIPDIHILRAMADMTRLQEVHKEVIKQLLVNSPDLSSIYLNQEG